ncbi:MAG: prephenate dehydrogenase/arogenate dehydrogenase family protein [Gammaproteobacteria bacterium]|nr:prephenate dehydrogenase/arogenate dehydrogenase family protein [Gammaproteobacteria bacterium]
MINKLTIIGVGLIGGSLARALRQAGACREIVGSGRNAAQLQKAVTLGVIDRYETDPAGAVQDADLVVLAVPVGATEAVLKQIQPMLAAHTVITDTGSAKASVIEAARTVFGEVPANFVPGHPIAGTEQSGVEASFAELFQQRRVVLTPLAHTDADAIRQVRAMWEQAGAEVMEMGAARHDALLAATSHLPHLLAYTLVDSLARTESHDDIFRFAAGGFRDFTRIAASDPVMWRDICLANRDAILTVLERFSADLGQLRAAIHAGDGARILDVFARAKHERDQFNG